MRIVHISCVVGARPNFIKMASILEEIRRRKRFAGRLIHTGQHFSPEMSDTFFTDLGMLQPDEHLNVPPGTQTTQTAHIMQSLERSFTEHHPDLVLVVGDVNSTLAAALVAAKLEMPIAHVEAGLRSFDRRMPEEINRIVTDTLSDYLFVSEPSGMRNLHAEGASKDRIFFVGNVMIDTLLRFRNQASQSNILESLGLEPRSYAVATLHRPANVDDAERLRGLTGALARLAERIPVVFPAHPRTRRRMEESGVAATGLLLTPPMGYLDFLRLTSQARLVLTHLLHHVGGSRSFPAGCNFENGLVTRFLSA
jgi:UDP-N-acetylglucosamine 2-epimerase (non-hydrolysing)